MNNSDLPEVNMSRIGKMPIKIPEGVKVDIQDKKVIISGTNGELRYILDPQIGMSINNNTREIVLTRKNDSNTSRALHGLSRSLIYNMILGVCEGFRKELEISGVGYRASLQDNKIVLQVGFSHPVEVQPPEGITFGVSKNIITVSGCDKQKVGELAAKIRSIRPPEPYKGKGIKYVGEKIRRKLGKAAKVGAEG